MMHQAGIAARIPSRGSFDGLRRQPEPLASALHDGAAGSRLTAHGQGDADDSLVADHDDLGRCAVLREGLRGGVDKYLYVLMAQLATSAECVRLDEIGPRRPRWLLMTQDRAHADSFHVTRNSSHTCSGCGASA